jgi:microcystin-dependent protein
MCQVNSFNIEGLNGFIISDTAPGANDQDKAWIKTSGGAPLGLPPFIFFNSQWIAAHPLVANGIDRRWVTDITNLTTYDGGDTNPPGQASGPMWVEDTDFQGRSPMHPGTVPGSTPAQTIAANANLGEGTHQLVMTELPAAMTLQATLPGQRPQSEEAGAPQFLAPTGSGGNIPTTPASELATFGFTNTGGDQPHQTVHPVRGLYAIKRSGRIYYRGA